MKKIIRQVLDEQEIEYDFYDDLRGIQFPHSYFVASCEWYCSAGKRRSQEEMIDRINGCIWGAAGEIFAKLEEDAGKEFSFQEILAGDQEVGRFTLQKNDMTFTRSGSTLLIKSATFSDYTTKYTRESIGDALMYHDMCSRNSEWLKYINYFIPLENWERHELMDEQRKLLAENEKIMNDMRLIQWMLYR